MLISLWFSRILSMRNHNVTLCSSSLTSSAEELDDFLFKASLEILSESVLIIFLWFWKISCVEKRFDVNVESTLKSIELPLLFMRKCFKQYIHKAALLSIDSIQSEQNAFIQSTFVSFPLTYSVSFLGANDQFLCAVNFVKIQKRYHGGIKMFKFKVL